MRNNLIDGWDIWITTHICTSKLWNAKFGWCIPCFLFYTKHRFDCQTRSNTTTMRLKNNTKVILNKLLRNTGFTESSWKSCISRASYKLPSNNITKILQIIIINHTIKFSECSSKSKKIYLCIHLQLSNLRNSLNQMISS